MKRQQAIVATIAMAICPLPATAATGPSVKRFGAWIVGCDATGRCETTEARSCRGDAGYVMSAARAPGLPGTVTLRVESQWSNDGDYPARPAGPDRTAYLVDGRQFAAVAPTGDIDAQLMASLRQLAAGRTLAIVDYAGRTRVSISLTGASAALRYMDAMQGRAGHPDAVVAVGPAPNTLPPTTAPVAPSLRPILCRLA